MLGKCSVIELHPSRTLEFFTIRVTVLSFLLWDSRKFSSKSVLICKVLHLCDNLSGTSGAENSPLDIPFYVSGG